MSTASAVVPVGYKQTEVGVIPEDWNVSAIDSLIDLLTGFPFPSSNFARIGIRLLRGANIKRGTLDWSENTTEFWPAASFDTQKFNLQVGDVVVAMDGSLVGRSFAQISLEDTPVLLVQRVARIRSKLLDMNFLKEWVCSIKFTTYCDSVKTVTAIPHISPLDIKSFKIAFPNDVREQEKIAKSLSDSEYLIQSLENLIFKKQDIKQGTMQELLTGKTRLPGFTEDWEVKQLNQLCSDIKRGASPRPITNPKWFDNNSQIGWVRISDATSAKRYLLETKQKISREGVRRSRYIPKGNLIMSICATVGRPIQTQIDVCIHDGFVIFENIFIDQNFLYYVLCDLEPRWSDKGQTGSQMNLNTKLIKSTEIFLPSDLSEQEAIAEVLSDMDAEIATLEERLEKAKAIKQGMMQQLLTGKIRLVEPQTSQKVSV
jgi:type I restriction enzyme, S subunit